MTKPLPETITAQSHLDPKLLREQARFLIAQARYELTLRRVRSACEHKEISEVENSGLPPFWYCLRCGSQTQGWTASAFGHWSSQGKSKIEYKDWIENRP